MTEEHKFFWAAVVGLLSLGFVIGIQPPHPTPWSVGLLAVVIVVNAVNITHRIRRANAAY